MSIVFSRLSFWFALVGLIGLVLFIRANTSVAAMPDPPVAPPVKPFARSIGASGIIEARSENTHIGAPFAGLVNEVRVAVWQKVSVGDPLFSLDDRELRAQLTTARAELALRTAEAARARRLYERITKADAGAGVSEEEIETREGNVLVAVAAVAKAQSAIDSTEQLLERFVVTAPISGTVLQVNLRAGEYVTPGNTTPAMIIGSIEEMQVRADVDEQLAPRVQPNSRALAYRKGESSNGIPLTFVRIEPFIVPKKSLTGSGSERVDTRVLQVIFAFSNNESLKTYVGQQVDIFIEELE